MEATEHPPEPVTSPYQTWSEWRKRSVEYRMDQLSVGDSDQVKDIILSFVGDALPDAALQSISECLNHPKSEVRAATLCALASKTSEVNPDYIKEEVQGRFADCPVGGGVLATELSNFVV